MQMAHKNLYAKLFMSRIKIHLFSTKVFFCRFQTILFQLGGFTLFRDISPFHLRRIIQIPVNFDIILRQHTHLININPLCLQKRLEVLYTASMPK